MRSHVEATAVLALFHLFLAVPLAVAQQASAAPASAVATEARPSHTGTGTDVLTLGPGDRLQIAAYQREDLSGTFRIGADGTISVPSVGRLPAAGRTPSQLEKDLGTVIEQATGRGVPLSIEVETWRPIYAVGDVDRPGVYPFTPGMTVLQTLATAGGMFRPLREAGALEVSRQAATVVQITERLKLALAERARIAAERNGKNVVEASQKLLELASSDEVERLIATETAILRDNQNTRTIAAKANAQEIVHIRNEIEAYLEQRKELKNRIDLTAKELGRYEGLAEKGLARSARVLQLRTEIANLEGTAHAVLASIARSERSLIEANRTKDNIDIARRLELEQQLRRVEGEIREFERSLDIYESLVLRMTQMQTSATAPKMATSYEIVRGSEVISATETTRLQPGDVVRVLTEKQPASDTAALGSGRPPIR